MAKRDRDFREMKDCAILYADQYMNDVEGERLEELAAVFLEKGVKKLIIDFSRTELINSIGISILVGIMDKLREKEGVLFFSGLKKANHDMFNMLGLTRFVPVCKTEEDALAMMGRGATAGGLQAKPRNEGGA
ncbi:MAG: STAS domain-containing protein [Deltaproteobacteria bacterium]|nr:STAS domain-containing protein [Deltaproteobacteria bacterium]